jgi:hypothetical protein
MTNKRDAIATCLALVTSGFSSGTVLGAYLGNHPPSLFGVIGASVLLTATFITSMLKD